MYFLTISTKLVSILAALSAIIHVCIANGLDIESCGMYQRLSLQEAWSDSQMLLGRLQRFLESMPQPNDVYEVFFEGWNQPGREALLEWTSIIAAQDFIPGMTPKYLCASQKIFARDWSALQSVLTAESQAECLTGQREYIYGVILDGSAHIQPYVFICPASFTSPVTAPTLSPALCPSVQHNYFPLMGPGSFIGSQRKALILLFTPFVNMLPWGRPTFLFCALNTAVFTRATPTIHNVVSFLQSKSQKHSCPSFPPADSHQS